MGQGQSAPGLANKGAKNQQWRDQNNDLRAPLLSG